MPSVAFILKPSLMNSLAISAREARSFLEMVISTVPLVGSGFIASWAFQNARPKDSAMPSTSPVDLISGPSSGSTSGNMLKGNTASLTPVWGIERFFRFKSFIFFPIMRRVAAFAIGMLHTLDTRGTVLEARGFASRT